MSSYKPIKGVVEELAIIKWAKRDGKSFNDLTDAQKDHIRLQCLMEFLDGHINNQ